MLIYIGADHRGFALKEKLKIHLASSGYEVIDFGNKTFNEEDDYVDFARDVAMRVSKDPSLGKGILLCGSGVGMDIVANKFRNVRASLCFSPDHALVARTDDDPNILVLGADFIDEDQAKKIISTWLQTPFSEEERHVKRLEKIEALERTMIKYID